MAAIRPRVTKLEKTRSERASRQWQPEPEAEYTLYDGTVITKQKFMERLQRVEQRIIAEPWTPPGPDPEADLLRRRERLAVYLAEEYGGTVQEWVRDLEKW